MGPLPDGGRLAVEVELHDEAARLGDKRAWYPNGAGPAGVLRLAHCEAVRRPPERAIAAGCGGLMWTEGVPPDLPIARSGRTTGRRCVRRVDYYLHRGAEHMTQTRRSAGAVHAGYGRHTRRSLAMTISMISGAALAACGAPADSAGSGDAQKTAAPAPLSFATLYKEDPSWQLSRKQMADFEVTHPNVKVQTDWITGSTGDYLKKVQTYLAGGSQPDVLYIHYLQTAIFGAPGVLLDLTKHTGQDKAFANADFVEGVADHFRFRSKPVGVAWYSGPHTLLFNKTLFQRAGVKHPEELEKEGKWTWDTFREAAQKLTTGAPGSPDRTIGVAGVSDGSIRLGRWERFVWQNGGELFNKEFTKSQFNAPAAAGAFTFVSELATRDKSLVTPEDARQLVSSGSAFLSGKVGMHYGIARDAMTAPVEAARQAGFELGLVPLPKGKAGRQNLDGPQAYGIGAATKAPDAAWELVKWWADEQRQAERLELAASVPVRKSMQRHKAFTGNLRPFESPATLEESVKTVRAPYSPANLEDLERVVNENWTAVLSGQKSLGAALEDMTKQVDALLKGA